MCFFILFIYLLFSFCIFIFVLNFLFAFVVDCGHSDTKLQAQVEKVKDEGKLEVNVTCDKFKNLGERGEVGVG